MATSNSAGEILWSDTELGADRFVDTMLMRDMVDSALHKCDEAGQVRIAWMAPSGTVWPAGGATRYEAIYGDGTAGAIDNLGTDDQPFWYNFGLTFRYAPKVRADGRGYRLRIYMAGACSGAGTCDFGVVVLAGNISGRGWTFFGGTPTDGTAGYPVAFQSWSGVTSTSAAWLTSDGNDYISIPSAMIEHAYSTEPSYPTNIEIGGAATTLVMPSLKVVPLASTRTEGVVPHLYALYAAETVGDT